MGEVWKRKHRVSTSIYAPLLVFSTTALVLEELPQCDAFVGSKMSLLASKRRPVRLDLYPCFHHRKGRPRIHFKHTLRTSKSDDNNGSRNAETYEPFVPEEGSWVASGDTVYEDLNRLEQAIAFANAEQSLQHQERLEMLNYFAKQRRPVQPDIIRFLVLPLMYSSSLTVLLWSSVKFFHTTVGRGFKNLVSCLSAVHFTILVVLAPVLLWAVKRWKATRLASDADGIPPDLQRLDSDYFRFMTTVDWEDPKTSCRDYVLVLLEHWVSAVVGVAMVSWLLPSNRFPFQILGRLAAMAALHQYPKLWFQLIRSEQPQPEPWPVWAVRGLTALQWTPYTVATDLSLYLSTLSLHSILIAYGSITLLLACTHAKLRITPKSATKKHEKLFTKRSSILQFKGVGFGLFLWVFCQALKSRSVSFYRSFAVLRTLSLEDILVYLPWKAVFTRLVLVFALTAPVCHLVSFLRLVRVSYTHDLSLALDVNDFKKHTQPESDEECHVNGGRYQWRYRLTWREPKRLLVTINDWRRGFWYWFFFSGTVQEKLRKEFHSKENKEAEKRGLTVLQQVARTMDPDAPMPDRTKWKQSAMEKLAREHKREFEQGSLQDPLGVAIHQTFGIGLGFNFDHMSELKESQVPSTRRLQARAAKSAIKRAQDIFDTQAARKTLDEKIQDPVERNKKASQLRKQAEQEIQYLAKRLTELVPTDLSLDSPQDEKIQQYELRTFSRISRYEYMINTGSSLGNLLESLKKFRHYGASEEGELLNPSTWTGEGAKRGKAKDPTREDKDSSDRLDNEASPKNSADTSQDDVEFIEAWEKRYGLDRHTIQDADDQDGVQKFLA